MKITEMSATELAKQVKTKQLSATEVVKSHLANIDSVDGGINAFLKIFHENAVKQAEIIDKKIANNEPVGKLCGVPVAIKDNICIKNTVTTCASKILENYVAPYNATVINKLISEDAVFIGKTNMDEFAMGSSTENSAYKKTKNPYNKDCIPGGSSGGSAACVSAKMAPVSLGSDTGGSIRQPASLCGVIGMKPTYGRVSRYGLIAFASSLDQIGPFARNVEDIALLSSVISGYDTMDSTSINIPVPEYNNFLNKGIKDLKIGLPKEYFISGLDEEVKTTVLNAVKKFESMGCKIEEVSLPHTEYAVAVYYILASSEASTNLARYDGVKYGVRNKTGQDIIEMYKLSRGSGFGKEVQRRIILGTYALSAGYYDAYYGKAQKVRTLIKQDFEKVFEKYDIILTPTSPTTAFKLGEKTENPLQMYLSDIFTIPVNLAGLPAMSIPCGMSKSGLPIGLQVISKFFDEQTMLNVASGFERSR